MEKKTEPSVLAENDAKSNCSRRPSMNSYDLAIELTNNDDLLREKQQNKISLSVKEAIVGITVVRDVLICYHISKYLILNDPIQRLQFPTVLQAGAVILSIIGVVLFAYSDGFGTFAIIGVVLAVTCSVISAFYRVFVKLIIGDRPLLQISLLVSNIGVISLFLSWIPVIILSNIGVDINLWSTIPWGPLMVAVAFNVLYNFLVILGIAITYPIFVSLGALFGIPLNSIIDAVTRNLAFTEAKIFGTVLLILAFVILLIPTGKAIKISQKFTNIILCKVSKDTHHPQD
ncbi:uncharacterized protein TRIADDRAFT_52255 [Trichoplax adhaerens]|uniref:EamA domain-containing protein n=1 Tax=Trichoplax adhaerens TaxID=10228 RepID=B3RM69_TRIAD|nr:hypothetical protein TRIADDRAFT_52255 [Trichoplax adhaerens]EDV29645.1 hypothetical protein TRIADDRAFT_52255 [Trichoplax adhaerens]|eukprot:XP_002108847.1 hypothetical protein TRIADDRAFT_52255 [Trichoplax adhaerens]